MQGNLNLQDVCPETLGGLYSVEGYLDLYYCYNLTSLGDLSHVGEWLDLRHTKIISLGNLTHVGEWLDLRGTNITSLGRLQHVGGHLDLEECENLTSLGNLTHVGENLYLRGTKVTSLGNLQHVGGSLFLNETPIAKKYSKEEIRKMVNVKGNIYL